MSQGDSLWQPPNVCIKQQTFKLFVIIFTELSKQPGIGTLCLDCIYCWYNSVHFPTTYGFCYQMLPVDYTAHCKHTRYSIFQETDKAMMTTNHWWCSICCTIKMSESGISFFWKIDQQYEILTLFCVCLVLQITALEPSFHLWRNKHRQEAKIHWPAESTHLQ